MRLGTTNETVRLSHFTILFGQQQGDATKVKTLKATLLKDTNANGIVDVGEPLLATRQAQGAVNTITLDITPPLNLLLDTVVHLLVTLDINSTTTLASVGPAAGLAVEGAMAVALTEPVLIGGVAAAVAFGIARAIS